MRKKWFRAAALALATMVAVSMTGCANGKDAENNTGNTAEDGEPQAGEDEVVTLKMFIRNQS